MIGWGGGEESVKYTFTQQMRIRSDYGSGFKIQIRNLVFGCEFLNLLLSGSGSIQNGSGSRSKFKNPACKTLFYVVRIRIRKIRIRITSTFSYHEIRSLDILLSKLNSKRSLLGILSLPCLRAYAVACVRAHVHGCVRARVHGCVRACSRACVRMGVPTASILIHNTYRNAAQHALEHF